MRLLRRCWSIDHLYGVSVRVSVEKLASHTAVEHMKELCTTLETPLCT